MYTAFWFRRDLRLHDNAGLYHALRSGRPVLPVFIFDTDILDTLPLRDDARVTFIHHTISQLHARLGAQGSTLLVYYGRPAQVWADLAQRYPLHSVYTNRDYEPYARRRDESVRALLQQRGIGWHSFKDHVLLEYNEVLKPDGTPYTVFTPYSKRWRAVLQSRLLPDGTPFYLQAYPVEKYQHHFAPLSVAPVPRLSDMGFVPNTHITIPPATVPQERIRLYGQQRNFPAVEGTSRLGVHFRFGTISIRDKARKALSLSDTFLNELIWRDFYAMIVAHFPHVAERAFKPAYDRIAWRDSAADLERWCSGTTGYPLVDAGMRELNATGYMHNRVRMVVASFLTKHLLLDWRLGEAYFAERLLDFDLASNNGGWQWAAGSGTDAAPYFRIFNPMAQAAKFDPQGLYIKRWVPEYGTARYPAPMVPHELARERCLAVYKQALNEA